MKLKCSELLRSWFDHTSQNRKKTILLCTLMGKSTIALICKKKKRVNDKVETNLANVSNLKIWKNTISKCAWDFSSCMYQVYNVSDTQHCLYNILK